MPRFGLAWRLHFNLNHRLRLTSGTTVTISCHDGALRTSRTSLTGATEARGLEALISRATRAGKGAAPVERWNPDFCGDLDMEISRTEPGSIWHADRPHALVQLFSTVLRQDEDGRPIW